MRADWAFSAQRICVRATSQNLSLLARSAGIKDAARPANIPASGQNGIYRKNDTQLARLVESLPQWAREYFEERAGILEYEANFPPPPS
jgi:hypothetical protein